MDDGFPCVALRLALLVGIHGRSNIVSLALRCTLFPYLIALIRSWRWAYGVGTLYGAVVVFTIAFFMEETYVLHYSSYFTATPSDMNISRSMYDRHLKTQPPRTTGLRYRIETLIGITGIRMSKYRQSWFSAIIAPLMIVWRPHLLMLLIFEGVMFGFSIGLNVGYLDTFCFVCLVMV